MQKSEMSERIESVSQQAKQVIAEVERAIVGKRELLERIMLAVLAGGHLLIEDFPGLAKTLIAKSFAVALGLQFKRIQFTPDLLPGDITGSYIYNRNNGQFELRQGPVFANIILADEINRASPKTQAALLEAMQESQVTLEGERLALPEPFIVMATQNPIEFEGTFALPEAQLDRFLMKLSVGYPSEEQELEILQRRMERREDEVLLKAVTNATELMEMRRAIEEVHVESDVARYIVRLVQATRTEEHIAVGASPRAALALLKLARAKAALDGRSYVIPDDVKFMAPPVLIHRLILKPDMWARDYKVGDVVERVVHAVPVPKV